ncbi:outer membrane protein assembly factor BamB family protein [Alienimonas californiensis]|uniref:Serine/threonine-protein kinase AfsK n=1 Tax=Alienimonas californiensis TaxID=2527989 RepID=A0A517P8Q6_9PLAN|nr:PQQ-binding-like beta-propeller repeat protein [Alienimonas californiensis]QDT15751.1 Serine/threonine-protein kinase AfsK [Alienimonas californiensis]
MRVLTACLAAALAVGSPAVAADWPSFRGNPQLTGTTADTLPDAPKLLWTADAPDGVAATAAIVGDRVFTAGLSGELHCRGIKTGEPVWTYRTEEVGKFRPGFLSSPAVADGRVYLGDEDGFLHAVDAATGKKLWTFETGAEIISSPTLTTVPGTGPGESGDVPVVLFGSYDAKLYCLTAEDGKLRWELETQGRVHCTPAVAQGPEGAARTFIAGCDEHLRGAAIADGSVTLDVEIGTYLIASPAAVDGTVYFGTYAGDVLAVDASSESVPGANVPEAKAVVWRAEPDGQFEFKSSAAATADRVFVTGGNKVAKALDRKTGKTAWEFLLKAGSESSPVVTGVGTDKERIWFGGADRTLHCLNAADGTEVWSQNLRKGIVASPAVGGPEGAAVLVIGTEGPNGQWFCFGG